MQSIRKNRKNEKKKSDYRTYYENFNRDWADDRAAAAQAAG